MRAPDDLLVDDNAAMREALGGLLQARPELAIVGEASNGLEAIALARALRPDVVVMDVSMPEMDGDRGHAAYSRRASVHPILGLSSHPRMEDLHPIEQVGGAGYFVKGADTQRLIGHLLGLHANLVLGSPGPPV